MLVIFKKRLTNTKEVKSLAEKGVALLRNKIEVRDFVSTDQFVCKTPGRLPTGYGRESSDCCFQGGTINNNDASSLLWVET